MASNALLAEIQKGKSLKKAVTNDRSAPLADSKSKGGPIGASSGPSSSNVGNVRATTGSGPPQLAGLLAGGIPKLKPTGSSAIGEPNVYDNARNGSALFAGNKSASLAKPPSIPKREASPAPPAPPRPNPAFDSNRAIPPPAPTSALPSRPPVAPSRLPPPVVSASSPNRAPPPIPGRSAPATPLSRPPALPNRATPSLNPKPAPPVLPQRSPPNPTNTGAASVEASQPAPGRPSDLESRKVPPNFPNRALPPPRPSSTTITTPSRAAPPIPNRRPNEGGVIPGLPPPRTRAVSESTTSQSPVTGLTANRAVSSHGSFAHSQANLKHPTPPASSGGLTFPVREFPPPRPFTKRGREYGSGASRGSGFELASLVN